MQDDIAGDQISLKEYVDPFMGNTVNKNKKKYIPLGMVSGRYAIGDSVQKALKLFQ